MQRLSIPSTVILLCCWSAVGFILSDGLSVPRHSSSKTRLLSFSSTITTTRTTTTETELKASSISSEYFSIETSNTGPANSPVHTLTIHKLPGQENKVQPPKAKEEEESDDNDDEENANGEASSSNDDNSIISPITIQTGKIGRQAAGAVTLTRGNTVLYATAARDADPKEGLGFLPLSVDHQERFSSAGMTSGGYNKRDGRPAEHEVLACRLIDRPLRPLIDQGWRHETQLLSWVLSYDGVRSCDPLAIVASSTALYLSDVPITKPVAAAMVGYDQETDTLLLNPTNEEMSKSQLNLVVAGTKDAVLMIEGAADFLPEATMLKAVKFGHDALKVICEAVEELGNTIGVTKKVDTLEMAPEGLQEKVDELMTEKVDAMFAAGGTKTTQGPVSKALKAEVKAALEEQYESSDIGNAFKDLLGRRMFVRAKETGLRCDGRGLEEIRQLDMETGWLPRTHGSAIFTRGETQVIATATLGDSGMRQKIDKIDGTEEKRFYLQYTFPPSCVGETGRVGAPGRREIGHGNLAERALIPTLPSEGEFPYSIRVESLCTESHGSSSMASVCGGCLALMDAGVPIKKPIAGIAMGMLLDDKDGVSDENAVILSDILGTEDALGTMDFKVAGDRQGITTFQLDIKCEGLSFETMERALEQARRGRLHILDSMEEVLSEARTELPDTVPKLGTFSIPSQSIGKVIGPGGKQIRAIIEDFELTSMNVGEEGDIQLSSFSSSKIKEAEEFVKLLIGGGNGKPGNGPGKREARPTYAGPEPIVGEKYTGPIKGIHPFGVFVEFMPGAEDGSTPGLEGLVHVSELAKDRVRNCEAFMKVMGVEELTVMYLGENNAGKRQLSRKAVLEGRKVTPKEESPPPPASEMSDDELDVIAKAIEGAQFD